MKKRLMKRVCALALSALLAGAVIQPVGALAQEAGADQTLQGGDADQTGQSGDVGQSGQSGDASQTLQGGDTSQTLQGGDAGQSGQNGEADQSGQNGGAGQSGQNGDAGQSDQNGPQVSLKAAASALSATYDTTKPVIEQVTLVQNGKTVTTEDQIELRVKAYDAQSGIKSVTALYAMEGTYSQTMILEYDEGQGLYIGTLDLGNVAAGKLYFDEIKVVDQNSNYELAKCYDDDYLYWVNVENASSIKVTDIQFPVNGQTIAEADMSDKIQGVSLTIDQELPEYSSVSMEFKSQEGDTFEINLYNSEGGSKFTFYGWYSSYYSEDRTVEYSLERIYLEREIGEEDLIFDDSASYSVKVEHKASTSESGIRVTGIEMTHQGETVKPGDKVELTVYAESDQGFGEYTYGTAYIYAAADIADRYKYVDLIYDEQQDCLTGTFEITEDTYPCEWYLDQVSVHDGYTTKYYGMSEEGYPYYVNVFNGDAFVDPVQNLSLSILKKNAGGNYVNVEYINKENVGRRTTLRELGITLPEFSSEIEGVNQTGWIDEYGNAVTEDTLLLNDYGYIAIYASYDKLVVPVTYYYATDNGEQKYVSQACLIEKGTTYGELWEKASAYRPDDMTQQYKFEKWEISDSYHSADEVLSENDSYGFSMRAKYEGYLMIGVSYHYYDEDGYTPSDLGTSKTLMVKEGTSVEEAMKELEEPDVVMYDGLRFTGWTTDYSGNGDDTVLSNGADFYVYANYENCMIRYVIDPRCESFYGEVRAPYESLVCQVAEVGETVTVPQTFDGYESIQWAYNPYAGGSFVAQYDRTFYGFGVKSGEENTDGGNTNGGTENPGNAGGQPSVLPSETINSVVSAINGAAAGENITVAMGGATVVPKAILEAAKGKDVNIVLDMGGYTWTINGMDILASDLQDINLEVKFDTNAIPSNVVKALAGDNPVRQISLTHNGDFGFKATLTMNAGAEYSGKYGNLYYYDSDGKMVFINAGTIDESGNVSLEFSHASDYLLVMSDKQMSQADVPDELQPQGEGTGAEANTNGVKTGDETNAVPYLVLMILCAGVVGTIVVRKKYFTK